MSFLWSESLGSAMMLTLLLAELGPWVSRGEGLEKGVEGLQHLSETADLGEA